MKTRNEFRHGWGMNAAVLLCLVLAAGLSACVSEVVSKPEKEVTLIVTRAGNEATLSWMARDDLAYTVMYTDHQGSVSPWQVLPGAVNLRGKGGETLYVKDRILSGQARFYRLQPTLLKTQ